MSESERNLAIAALNISAAMSCLAAAMQLGKQLEKAKKQGRVKRLKEYKKPKKWPEDIPTLRTSFIMSAELETYKWCLGMNEECFQKILSYIEKDISKRDTIMKEAVPATTKLAATLRYLATGENFAELGQNINLSRSYCRGAVFEVCQAIFRNMKEDYLKFPCTNEEWLRIADEFAVEWQFPHCIGALSVYPVRFAPAKRTTVLLAMVDAFARFTFAEVGCKGKSSNEEILASSQLSSILNEGNKYFPEPTEMGNNRNLPYVIAGDETLPLMNNLLTPYSESTVDGIKRNLNSRLGVARRNVEKAFGVMSERFKIFQKTTTLREDKVEKIVQCCCVLHNFLTTNSESYRVNTMYTPMKTANHKNLTTNTTGPREPELIRYSFAEFFSTEEPLI